MEAFSLKLKRSAAELWRQELGHPFVQGIGRGDLEEEKFRFYLKQDYLFLLDYCRVFALAVSRSESEEEMAFFESLLHATLRHEMDLHRDYAVKFGIERREMEAEPYGAATYSYTRHLLESARSERLEGLLAALLPCSLGYWEIGCKLKEAGRPGNPLYAEWIDMYSCQEFGDLAQEMCRRFDLRCRDLPLRDLKRFEGLFLRSVRYEIDFWEMSWRMRY